MRSNRFLRLYLSYLIPILVVVAILGGGSSLITRYIVNRNVEENARGQLRQIMTYYETILDGMDALTLQFSSNSEISRRFQAITKELSVDYNEYRESIILEGFVSSIMNSRELIEDIYIYVENPRKLILCSQYGFANLDANENKEWVDEYMVSTHLDSNSSTLFKNFIRISRPITNSVGKQIGVIILDLKKDSLVKSMPLSNNASLSVYSESGELLFSAGDSDPDSMIFSDKAEGHGWSYNLMYAKKELYYTSNVLLAYTILLTILSVLLAFFLTKQAHKKEVAFLKVLIEKFNQKPNKGELDQYTDVYDYVNYHIIQTFLEGDYMKLQKERAEYRALQLQLNPHFLFNTLDTINWKAIRLLGGENDVSSMIQLLSKLLQYTLRSNLDGVELSTEIEQSKRYLAIQKYRFQDKFNYSESIDQSLLSQHVPSLFLEPLLENIFVHAFQGRKVVNVFLKISKKTNDLMEIQIINDGKELSPDEVRVLNEECEDILVRKKSMGIANTRKRLDLFYKGKASLEIKSLEGIGVEVLIILPIDASKANPL